MKRDYKKALQWFTKAVNWGSKEAKTEAELLKKVIERQQNERDYAILQAIYNLRRRMAVGLLNSSVKKRVISDGKLLFGGLTIINMFRIIGLAIKIWSK